jgi:hypothetical protein
MDSVGWVFILVMIVVVTKTERVSRTGTRAQAAAATTAATGPVVDGQPLQLFLLLLVDSHLDGCHRCCESLLGPPSLAAAPNRKADDDDDGALFMRPGPVVVMRRRPLPGDGQSDATDRANCSLTAVPLPTNR